MFRTRLTHSLEVAQIGRTIARILNLNEDLTESIALAHDLGHTPFGHAGQDVLNDCMREYGGFEHNLQSLRVVDELEHRYADFHGLNLTFESREGILKHCSNINATKLGDVGERFLNKQQPSLEAQVTNLADEIAYNNHDVDDGIRAGLIDITMLRDIPLFNTPYEEVIRLHPSATNKVSLHETIRRMIKHQASDLVEASDRRIRELNPQHIDDIRTATHSLIGFSDDMREQVLELKRFLRANVYKHYRVHRMTAKAERIIRALFSSFMDDTVLLPHEHVAKAKKMEEQSGVEGRARAVADYVAGMTDRFAIAEYSKLFDPTSST